MRRRWATTRPFTRVIVVALAVMVPVNVATAIVRDQPFNYLGAAITAWMAWYWLGEGLRNWRRWHNLESIRRNLAFMEAVGHTFDGEDEARNLLLRAYSNGWGERPYGPDPGDKERGGV